METGRMMPFDEDCRVGQLAGDFGLSVDRRDHIEVTDEKLLIAAGLMRTTPDYGRIRKLLLDGVAVPGARLVGVEYILRRKA